ncbi:(2Fe-2S)-binding protein [Acinetobacter sp. MB5]|uniref:(2Fe-2S)-binding protein n=1 Tax=Acinetobacter sp. MB5 TaxID=2069438 RepID=UPI000DCFA672|nr:(2Fe-2S)-binding protein [Acinetobacter sp. MB5]
MCTSIPCIAHDCDIELSDFSAFQKELMSTLNIQVMLVDACTYRGADLLDPVRCFEIIQIFAEKIKAKNSTCAGSMLIKYWVVPLLYPYWYSSLFQQRQLPWAFTEFVFDLPEKWAWNRTLTLNISPKNTSTLLQEKYDFESLFFMVFRDLNSIFEVISQVAKVPKKLLWENTALRILQFYDMILRKQQLICGQAIQQQRQFLMQLSAKHFELTHNPFGDLIEHWNPDIKTYCRQKCCFYFQLPEAQYEYCKSCPLQNRVKTKDKYLCTNI